VAKTALRVNRPGSQAHVLTVRVRLRVGALPAGASITVTDMLFQPGSTATGWVAHATEKPWMAGVHG
jgi:hypothetical protein